MAPQDLVAQQFMAHKGLGDVRPTAVERVSGTYCWYYTYVLPDGVLELEVSYDSEGWDAVVCTFQEHPKASA